MNLGLDISPWPKEAFAFPVVFYFKNKDKS